MEPTGRTAHSVTTSGTFQSPSQRASGLLPFITEPPPPSPSFRVHQLLQRRQCLRRRRNGPVLAPTSPPLLSFHLMLQSSQESILHPPRRRARPFRLPSLSVEAPSEDMRR